MKALGMNLPELGTKKADIDTPILCIDRDVMDAIGRRKWFADDEVLQCQGRVYVYRGDPNRTRGVCQRLIERRFGRCCRNYLRITATTGDKKQGYEKSRGKYQARFHDNQFRMTARSAESHGSQDCGNLALTEFPA